MTVEDSVIDLSFEVVVKETNETFWLEIECFDEVGGLVFAAGPLEVMATTSGEVEAQDVEVEYVGVGSDAVAVEILDPEVFIEFGEMYTLQAQALDDQGAPIPGTPIKWVSLNTDRVTVPDAAVGQIRGGSERGSAQVEAQLLTGPTDVVDVFVEPVPNSITVVSGDGQTRWTLSMDRCLVCRSNSRRLTEARSVRYPAPPLVTDDCRRSGLWDLPRAVRRQRQPPQTGQLLTRRSTPPPLQVKAEFTGPSLSTVTGTTLQPGTWAGSRRPQTPCS
jgi:hypothetical protein